MTADQLTYRRAATAALAGLGVQLLLTILIGVMTIWTGSHAFTAATWHLLGGGILWGALWLIYNQHRRERVEALEADELAASAGSDTTMFDEAGHELALSRKRLEGFYAWGLNVVSITAAVFLLAAGGALLYGAWSGIELTPGERANFTGLFGIAAISDASALALMLVAGAAALIGFLTARYVAGMTSEKHWQLLRGGSAYLMGNVVVLVGVVIASVFELGSNPWGFAVLSLLIPGLMVVLGLEITLSLIFGAYRPKLPGEVVRAAFDSRLLGWLTRPDSLGTMVAETVNYQFGFEISRSWFYSLLGKAILPLVGVGVGVLILLSCVVIVPPQQQAVVTTFGKVASENALREPGISFKAPWPFASTEKYETSRVHSLRVGSINDLLRTGVPMLWTNTHSEGGEDYLLTAPAVGADAGETSSAGGVSAGLIGGELVMQWRVVDLLAFVGATDPTKATVVRGEAETMNIPLLTAVADAAFAEYLASKDIDTLLTADRLGAAEFLKTQIQSRVKDMGIDVTYVGLYGLHPPQEGEVADAFLDVVNALLTQRTTVTGAERDRVGILSEIAGSVDRAVEIDAAIRELEALPPDADADIVSAQSAEIQRLIDAAGGEASSILAAARADRWQSALGARANAEAFQYEATAFQRSPEYFKSKAYYDTLARVLPGARKVITAADTGDTLPLFRLNLEDEASGLDAFLGTE
ncbi:MAG: SPFH domain-containing protein [Planctomycetota bacterium]